MSLFGTIQLARNALQAADIGLQVTGQNIANANTPGYLREEVIFTPAETQRFGNLLLGLGVEVAAVVQRVDGFLLERLRSASSDRASSDSQTQTYLQLEQVLGELSDTDLSSTLNTFFAGISEILNQPESVSIRNLAVLHAERLTGEISRLASRVVNIRQAVNSDVENGVADVNRLVDEITNLNLRITQLEAGDVTTSDAVGLRDQRVEALSQLAELADIRTEEQSNGSVNVFVGGDFLVFGGTSRHVVAVPISDRGLTVSDIRVEETDAALQVSAGRLHGLLESRDTILGGFLDDFDQFAATLAFEFNKVYSSGQGLTGYQQLTSEFFATDTAAPLDAAGLAFTPVNGSFQVLVFDKQTGLTQTSDIFVDLDGLGSDTSLADLVSDLDAVDGISASIDSNGRVVLQSASQEQDFGFANDTSGVLAAVGLNIFFTGTTSLTIGVHQDVVDDPAKFAASRGGIGNDSENAVDLARFLDLPLETANSETLSELYERIVNETTQATSVSQSVTEGFSIFEEALLAQHLGVSGVSIDEEIIDMIGLQRAYQASARLIATIDELLEMLVNL